MMDYLYSPWRSGYINDKNREDSGCTFCTISKEQQHDRENRLLYRDAFCFMVMNKFPYTPGHFMVIPHRHVAKPSELTKEEWGHLAEVVRQSTEILEAFGAEGINMGMNLGIAGGAGIPKHLHMHLVPRWIGDTNFITSIGESRVYGVDFDDIYQKLKNLVDQKLHV